MSVVSRALSSVCVIVFALLVGTAGRAAEPASDDDALFASSVAALREGRAGDAIAGFEALGDRGVVDAAVSFDRGLSYAERVRIGGEQPGDLGRAAQGFEEARALTSDRRLEGDATEALALVRAEVARRRSHAGDVAELEQGTSLGRTIVRLLPEQAWCFLAAVASGLVTLALFVRHVVRAGRARIAATITGTISLPVLVLAALAVLVARFDRHHLRTGVIVSASARPSNENGLARPGVSPLPEAAKVEILGERAGWTRVRWGAVDAWVPSNAVRSIVLAENAREG